MTFRVVSLHELLKFHANAFVKTTNSIRDSETIAEVYIRDGRGSEKESNSALSLRVIDGMHFLCELYGLDTAARKCDRISESMKSSGGITYEEVKHVLTDLRERIEDELGSQYFLHMTPQECDEFQNPLKDWTQVCDRFHDATRDIEEMRKCYALNRYPASIFHSMQVVEHGLIHLGTWLDVKDRKTGWVATTNELKRIVALPYKDRAPWQNRHYSFIEQMQAVCLSLMTAWRHKIDHASGRLTLLPEDFAPEIARNIIDAARAFMHRLAIELPEGKIND